MLFFHEVHELRTGAEAEFEHLYRERWMPALAEGDDARLIWYWRHANASSRPNNIITVAAVKDAASLSRLSTAIESGRLHGLNRELDALRRDVVACVLVNTRWSELKDRDLWALSSDPAQRHEPTMYVEDVVWPPNLDDYVTYAGEHWYRPAATGTGKVRARITMPAFFQSAYGTGIRPEVYLIQKLLDTPEQYVRNLLATDYPPEMRSPDHYFVSGLKVRDQWESKIVFTSEWSPLD